mmetsp:Transcript_85352/g.166981  ORF Transcript_85352/g.166981 Transcript_85352/m.166981 type:complete len:1228 (+) Transcript_85352:173-3856(+)|eukprot:CAMPEP_0170372854 /NCGR_PEP_ID=MMETSP0117_2-20130122/9769_1 /TAXON_ID=400756 /ORGANISM="Durinskia baltica, Strain CSIRO CS-38" /LENGTH=1227 /DNA_ID=CAMNT_0010627729 /DNA_START=163 /DNA_END=3846 /DNA_ORIENTATION=+
MVLKAMFASSLEEEEEEMLLRKCHVRKAKRLNEKSRRISQQENESLQSGERVPSPVPPPSIRSTTTPGSRSKEKYRSGYFELPKPHSHSTDDPYPAPSPPPRSPVFTSPSLGSRSLALSLSLLSPAGFVIASGGRKTLNNRYSPEPNVLNYQSVERTISSDSAGSGGGDGVQLFSPDGRARLHSGSPQSPLSPQPTTPALTPTGSCQQEDDTDATGASSYKEADASGGTKESNRVKQFLFHRDRERARKAQLLFNEAYGSVDFAPEGEDTSPHCTPHTSLSKKSHGSRSSPSKNNQRSHHRLSLHSSGGGGVGTRNSSSERAQDRYMRIDLETDIRAGTSGLVFTPSTGGSKTPRSPRSNSHSKTLNNHTSISPYTPHASLSSSAAAIAIARKSSFSSPAKEGAAGGDGSVDPYGSNSPYYRALTLGVPSPTAAKSRLSVSSGGDQWANSRLQRQQEEEEEVAEAGEPYKRRTSTLSSEGELTSSSRSGSEDSASSGASVHSAEHIAEYHSHFPALPMVPQQPSGLNSLSALSLALNAVSKRQTVSSHEDDKTEGDEDKEQHEAILIEGKLLESPVISPLKCTAEEVCDMFYDAVCQNDMPSEVGGDSKTGAARAMRAWDDADTDSDEECGGDTSDLGSLDSAAASAIATMQQQLRKIADVDATCANLMQKCDYIYDILKRQSRSKFDAQWMSNVVLPFCTSQRIKCPADTPTVRELLTLGHVHPALLYHLVQGLQYEDRRFESSRMLLISAFYTLSPEAISSDSDASTLYSLCLRSKIASALEHACDERRQRCDSLQALSVSLEMDVNYISKVGYSDLCTTSITPDDASSCLHSLTTGCDFTAVIESENERPTYKTRDSESGLLELMKFMIAQEVNRALQLMQQQEQAACSWSDETKSSTTATPAETSSSSSSSCSSELCTSKGILLRLTASYCHLFRCYTQKLGACYFGSSENVEQPALLEQLLQCLDGLLAWAKILCNFSHIEVMNLTPPSSSSGASAAASADSARRSVLDDVCEFILRSTARHWTGRLNFAQDIAYMLQCEVVLTIYSPIATPTTTVGNTSYASIYKASCSSGSSGCGSEIGSALPSLTSGNSNRLGKSAQFIVSQILRRLLKRVISPHMKVATQAIQSLQNPVIMVRYFLPRMTTAMVSYIFGTEVGRITFLSGSDWSNEQREDSLNALVDCLRECREIFSGPGASNLQLQATSTQLLDTTLELLQVIEDAE